MPTGYTEPVANGEITEFRDFALRCARAFGALIEFRDDAPDAEINVEKIGKQDIEYYERALAHEQERLTQAEAMTYEEAETLAAVAYEDRRLTEEEQRNHDRVEWERYSAMTEKVKAWEPPTPDHQGIKDFMLDQLSISSRFLDPAENEPTQQNPITRMTAAEYRADKIQLHRRVVEYHQEKLESARRAAEERRKWVSDLLASLATE